MAGAHAVQSGPTSQVSGSTRSRSRRSSWPTSSREHGSRATARSSARAVQRQGGGGGVAIRPVLHSQMCGKGRGTDAARERAERELYLAGSYLSGGELIIGRQSVCAGRQQAWLDRTSL